MLVIIYVPHNEGVVVAVITGPNFNSSTDFVDLYEVDADIRSVASEKEASSVLEELLDGEEVEWHEVPGGRVGKVES